MPHYINGKERFCTLVPLPRSRTHTELVLDQLIKYEEMPMLAIIMLIVAAACFALSAANVAVSRVNLIGAGLLAWVLSELIPALVK